MQILNKLIKCTVLMLVINWPAMSESFNSGELINHHGSKNKLAADEGYLYLSLDTNSDISRITIDAVGLSKKIRFNDIKKGNNYALLKVKAGEYYWEHINIYVGIGNIRKQLGSDEYSFNVKPGVVNYPGSWKFNGQWIENARARLSLQNYNWLSFEMEHYKKYYARLVGDVPFEYQSQIDDPYPKFLTEATNNTQLKPIPNLYYSTDTRDDLPMTMFTKDTSTEKQEAKYPMLKSYFQYDSQSIRSVNPAGNYLLFSSVLDEVVSIGLIRVNNYETFVLYQQKLPSKTYVSELDWIDNDSFFLTLTHSDVNKSYVAHLDYNQTENAVSASFIKFRADGHYLTGLSDQENLLFFQKNMASRSSNNNGLYQVDVSDEKSIQQSFRKVYKPTKKLDNVVNWLIDKDGQVRAALSVEFTKKDEEPTLHYWFLPDPKNNIWKKIKSQTGSDHYFYLKALSADEQYFLVLTNEFSDKYAIHKYATTNGAHLGVFHEDPEHDIDEIMVDPKSQQVVGYTYYENGLLEAHYFTPLDDQFIKAKQNNHDIQLFQVYSLAEQNRLILYGFSNNSKGAWYVLNTQTGFADKIFDTSPQYEQLPKGQHDVIKAKADDGVELEGFLVLPNSDKKTKHPLVVMPHGGPIGVRDFAHNNQMQHFLATQGIATLKVNYRGSAGYGKAFEELGKQQWGEKIEQDIHQVTQQVINKFNVDGSKICAMGGSYGGYSALMLTYLYPETYLCAISFAGVMDLPLLFTSRDLSRDDKYQEIMTDIVGDPTTELEKLVNKSPLYVLNQMTNPLLLFQGLEDSRVRPEHAFRMQQLISLYGMNHEVVLFEDEGHSYSHDNTVILYLDKSLDFIKQHLTIN